MQVSWECFYQRETPEILIKRWRYWMADLRNFGKETKITGLDFFLINLQTCHQLYFEGTAMDDNKFYKISQTIYFKTILGNNFDLLQPAYYIWRSSRNKFVSWEFFKHIQYEIKFLSFPTLFWDTSFPIKSTLNLF